MSEEAPEAAAGADGSAPSGLVSLLAPFVPAEDLPARLALLEGERAPALRVNTLRATLAEVRDELLAAGLEARVVPWCPGALQLPPGSLRALQATAAHAEGRLYVQGLSSQLVPLALAPGPGDRVLDLCAAPGSKTSQLAALMGGGAGLHANDRSPQRVHRLRSVLALLGVEGATLTRRAGQSFGRTLPEAFSHVLVDAPCSMEGRLRAGDADARSPTPRGRIRRLAGEQRALLLAGLGACTPGGVVVYATCTLAPEENELVLHKLLRRAGGAVRLEPLPWELPDALPGLSAWNDRGLNPDLVHARRLLPDGEREGFFVARLRKLSTLGGARETP
jgi:16S rRNA (cytosine1407-C5)-methyltransferase